MHVAYLEGGTQKQDQAAPGHTAHCCPPHTTPDTPAQAAAVQKLCCTRNSGLNMLPCDHPQTQGAVHIPPGIALDLIGARFSSLECTGRAHHLPTLHHCLQGTPNTFPGTLQVQQPTAAACNQPHLTPHPVHRPPRPDRPTVGLHTDVERQMSGSGAAHCACPAAGSGAPCLLPRTGCTVQLLGGLLGPLRLLGPLPLGD